MTLLLQHHDTRLVSKSDGQGASIGTFRPGRPYTYTVGAVCVDGPDRVTITSVEPHVLTGTMKVVDFSTTYPSASGDDRRSTDLDTFTHEIDAFLVGDIHHEARTRCGRGPDQESVAIEIDVDDADSLPVVADEVVVHYTSDGRKSSTVLESAFTLCSGTDRDSIVEELEDQHDTSFVVTCD